MKRPDPFVVACAVIAVAALAGMGVIIAKGAGPAVIAGPALGPVPVRTLPADNEVTGIYPTSCTYAVGNTLPDKKCTPGAAVAGANVCTTPAPLPPARELAAVQAKAAAAYNVRGPAELVWLVPQSLGGSNDATNLFVLPDATATAKASVDATIGKAVCAGSVGLASAQTAMATNWTTALTQLGIGG